MGWIGTEVSLDIRGVLGKMMGTSNTPIGPVVKNWLVLLDTPQQSVPANVCHPVQYTAESPGVFPSQNSGVLTGIILFASIITPS